MSRVRKTATPCIATLAVVLAGPGVALASPTSSGSAHDAQAAEARFLKEAITQTPYSALVVYTRVDIKPITGKNGRANAGASWPRNTATHSGTDTQASRAAPR